MDTGGPIFLATLELLMGADFIIHFSCRPKQALGGGNAVDGTAEMVRLVKVGHMVRFFEEEAARTGKSPDELSVTRQERNVTTGQTTDRPLSYRDLQADFGQLAPLAPDCADCPANLFGESFGCYAALRYPIPAVSEQWIMDRLQPADAAGGFLFRRCIADLGYDGSVPQRYREGGLFELAAPLERALDPKRPDEKVNANHFWHALFGVGWELKPFHCLYPLLWLGAIRLDGEVPATAQQLQAVVRLTTFEERRDRTDPDVGPTNQGRAIFEVQKLLFACYHAWLFDVPLLMDA